jgi:hypothetical protein
MTLATDQSIFDWHLDGTSFSGDITERSIAIDRYRDDISKIAMRRPNLTLHGVDFSDWTLERLESIETIEMDSDGCLSDLSGLNERSPVRPIVRLGSALTPLREWEGFVEAISAESFFVKLSDVTDTAGLPTDEAEFELKDLSGADRELLRVGSIIRWVVGFERLANDQRQRVSRVHVRRIPVFRVSGIDEARNEAEQLLKGILVDDASEVE